MVPCIGPWCNCPWHELRHGDEYHHSFEQEISLIPQSFSGMLHAGTMGGYFKLLDDVLKTIDTNSFFNAFKYIYKTKILKIVKEHEKIVYY